jgi:hypothetical protein
MLLDRLRGRMQEVSDAMKCDSIGEADGELLHTKMMCCRSDCCCCDDDGNNGYDGEVFAHYLQIHSGNAHATLLHLTQDLANTHPITVLLLRSLSSLSVPTIEGSTYNQGTERVGCIDVLCASAA